MNFQQKKQQKKKSWQWLFNHRRCKMGENSQAKVSIGKELGSLVKKNIRDYMMYIVLVAIIAFFAVKTRMVVITANLKVNKYAFPVSVSENIWI